MTLAAAQPSVSHLVYILPFAGTLITAAVGYLAVRSGRQQSAERLAWEAAQRESSERQTHSGYSESAHYGWAASGDGTRSRDELRALEALGLDPDAEFDAIRKAWRTRAKEVHPDVRPGDEAAAAEFQKLQLAYEVLRAAQERREWKG